MEYIKQLEDDSLQHSIVETNSRIKAVQGMASMEREQYFLPCIHSARVEFHHELQYWFQLVGASAEIKLFSLSIYWFVCSRLEDLEMVLC